jgi:hypothetical protein
MGKVMNNSIIQTCSEQSWFAAIYRVVKLGDLLILTSQIHFIIINFLAERWLMSMFRLQPMKDGRVGCGDAVANMGIARSNIVEIQNNLSKHEHQSPQLLNSLTFHPMLVDYEKNRIRRTYRSSLVLFYSHSIHYTPLYNRTRSFD